MEFHCLENDIVFISMLGANFAINKFEKLGICDENTTDFLLDKLEEHNTSNIVFDCSSVVYTDDQKVFERMFNQHQTKDRKILFFNMESELYERLLKDLENSGYIFEKYEKSNSYFSKNKIKSVAINNFDIIDITAKELKNNDIKILQNCSIKHKVQSERLLSTPIWSNYYFDVGKLFSDNPQKTTWILSRLCNKFRNTIRTNKKILLVSTSLHGTILATIMKEILNDSYEIETICFDRLGPDLLINEINHNKKEKYDYIIYVCDFIIAGTELKILKALLALRKLSINFVFSIGTFLKSNEYNFDSITLESIVRTRDIHNDVKYALNKFKIK